ncbi:MAG: hypothetical protein R2695_04300 [Acidimicrobiales bacterium]
MEDAVVLRFTAEDDRIRGSDTALLTLALPEADLVGRTTLWSYAPLTVVLSTRAITDSYQASYAGTRATP